MAYYSLKTDFHIIKLYKCVLFINDENVYTFSGLNYGVEQR